MQTLTEYGYAAYQQLSMDDDEGGQRPLAEEHMSRR